MHIVANPSPLFQGYLSFWNDNISYALRGCIVLELAFRGRIAMQKDPARRRFPLADRLIEVVDETLTGEVLLDEALKMMKASEKMSVSSWIDLMSGETWNLMKIGYQLKQVRERLAKGLVDKGILRTEKRNFLLFDMATHPVADGGAKEEIRRRVRNVLTQRTVVLPASQFLPENLEFRYLRTLAMVCAAYAANVLENALSTLGHEARERAFAQTDELLAEYSQWPFTRKATSHGIGANLPQVVADVGLPVLALPRQNPSPLLTRLPGNRPGQGPRAAARGRRRVSQRLYTARLDPVGASTCRTECMSTFRQAAARAFHCLVSWEKDAPVRSFYAASRAW